MTPTLFRPSRRELIRWAAATSILSGLELGCGGTHPPSPAWEPKFLTAAEVKTLEALADTVLTPDADGSGGGKSLGAAVFVDRLMSALDGEPKLHAEGPFSGRRPFADDKGVPSTRFPAHDFETFAPLDRVNAAAWRLRLFGSAGLAGGAPNEALLGAVTGLRSDVRTLLAHARTLAPDLATMNVLARTNVLNKLTEGERDLCLELVSQAAWSAPEYGGNRGLAGWAQLHFDGDSQPLGYSLWDASTNTYRERVDAPMSTGNPGTDPEPLDDATRELIGTITLALGGKVAP